LRHPIYTAILGLAFGTAFVAGRIVSLLGAPCSRTPTFAN
jgi:protein-S-isoprenylcysteine O-methyltransferase Ste14